MDCEELRLLIRQEPLRINMNDGSSFEIASPEMVSVSDISAAVLCGGKDGKLRHAHLPLVTMAVIEPLLDAETQQ